MNFTLSNFDNMNWTTKNISISKLLLLSAIGVVSIMFSKFPVLGKFNIPKWSILLQPLFLSILFIFLGFYFLSKSKFPFNFKNYKELLSLTKKGVIASFFTSVFLGFILFYITPYFENILPNFLREFNISIITKLFYGGINEEIIMRLGLLSFLYFIFNKFFKNRISWVLALLFSSLLFAIGHLPILYIEGTPDLNSILFVVTANLFFGVIFGFLYIKYNLTTSILAHALTHLFHYILILT